MYCHNNPIMYIDENGNMGIGTILLLAASVTALLITVEGINSCDELTKKYKDSIPDEAEVFESSKGKEIHYEVVINKEDEKKSILRIYNSYEFSKKDINEFLRYLKEDKGYSSINIDKVRNEWGWHKAAFKCGIKRLNTATAEIYFDYDDEEHKWFSWIMNEIRIF